MLKLINCGCSGHMGRVVTQLADSDEQTVIAAGVDKNTQVSAQYPVFPDFSELTDGWLTDAGVNPGNCAVIDFSSPSILNELLDFGINNKIALVLCTTGYNEGQAGLIEKASGSIPVFRSGNMSVGINLLMNLIKRACAVLGDEFDIEIAERHHRRKIDAPSGTALMLAQAAASALPYEPEYIFERESVRRPRGKKEIGISSVRGGTITGVHEVIFAGNDEVIELRHSAASRDVFAAGALRAAKFICGKPPGLYNMDDLLG